MDETLVHLTHINKKLFGVLSFKTKGIPSPKNSGAFGLTVWFGLPFSCLSAGCRQTFLCSDTCPSELCKSADLEIQQKCVEHFVSGIAKHRKVRPQNNSR